MWNAEKEGFYMSSEENESSSEKISDFDVLNHSLFSSFLSNFLSDSIWNSNGLKVDVREKPDEYIIEAEMPGLNKENVNIDIVDNLMTISAHIENSTEQKDENDHYLHRERHIEAYRRTFQLDRIKANEIKAEMKNGILTLYCPKKDKIYPDVRRLDIQ
jgi:HSP20 family protein